MSPITHYLASWVIADRAVEHDRDKFLIALAGILPDIDSLGIALDLANKALGRPETDFYATYHRLLFHGGVGCLFLALAVSVAALARNRPRVFGMALITTHLHLLFDFVGSRGPTPDEVWPIWYAAPFSQTVARFYWPGQWALNAWPNVLLTVLLLAYAFWLTWRHASSPISYFAPRVHNVLVETLRHRFGTPENAS